MIFQEQKLAFLGDLKHDNNGNNKKQMIQTPELVLNYYSLPFKYDGYSYVWDGNSNMCLMTVSNSKNINEFMEVLVRIMNGERVNIHPAYPFYIENGVVYVGAGNQKLLLIRGWGRLQYIKDENPELIQDTFGQWVVDILNDNIENETV